MNADSLDDGMGWVIGRQRLESAGRLLSPWTAAACMHQLHYMQFKDDSLGFPQPWLAEAVLICLARLGPLVRVPACRAEGIAAANGLHAAPVALDRRDAATHAAAQARSNTRAKLLRLMVCAVADTPAEPIRPALALLPGRFFCGQPLTVN